MTRAAHKPMTNNHLFDSVPAKLRQDAIGQMGDEVMCDGEETAV